MQRWLRQPVVLARPRSVPVEATVFAAIGLSAQFHQHSGPSRPRPSRLATNSQLSFYCRDSYSTCSIYQVGRFATTASCFSH
ncbi:hypothetical protein BDW66DRAFT_128350 [Aspergillus desertorum]